MVSPPPNANWFQIPFAVLTMAMLTLRAGAFIKTVRQRTRRTSRRAMDTNSSTMLPVLEAEEGL